MHFFGGNMVISAITMGLRGVLTALKVKEDHFGRLLGYLNQTGVAYWSIPCCLKMAQVFKIDFRVSVIALQVKEYHFGKLKADSNHTEGNSLSLSCCL